MYRDPGDGLVFEEAGGSVGPSTVFPLQRMVQSARPVTRSGQELDISVWQNNIAAQVSTPQSSLHSTFCLHVLHVLLLLQLQRPPSRQR